MHDMKEEFSSETNQIRLVQPGGKTWQRASTLISIIFLITALTVVIKGITQRHETFGDSCLRYQIQNPVYDPTTPCSTVCEQSYRDYQARNWYFDISKFGECRGCPGLNRATASDDVLVWMVFLLIHIVFLWTQAIILIWWGWFAAVLMTAMCLVFGLIFEIGIGGGMSGIFNAYHQECATVNSTYACWMYSSLAYPWILAGGIGSLVLIAAIVSALGFVMYAFVKYAIP